MSDPLSVAASIAGLLALAGKITTVIIDVTAKSKAAPKEIQNVKSNVETIRAVILQLQVLLLGRAKVERHRTSLILVEQVVITMSACVSTFSELDVFVDSLKIDSSMGLLDRVRWATKSSTIKELHDRLETHKASLTLMATILTCDSTYQAEDAVDALSDKIQEILNSHQVLAQRLLSIEIGMTIDQPLARKATEDFAAKRVSHDLEPQRNAMGFAFEEVLETSWVYKRTARQGGDGNFSIVSAAGRTASWSMLSGLSLSEISYIAVLALPVYEHDISNSEVYVFGEYDEKSLLLAQEPPKQSLSAKNPKKSIFSARLSRIAAGINFRPRTTTTTNRIGSSNISPSEGVFGVPLRQSIDYANVAISLHREDGSQIIYGYVPIVIAKTGKFLKEKATAVENIFQVSGSARRVSELYVIFNSPNRYGENVDWAGYTGHDAANLMLRYLKSLPEPVITFDLYERFVHAASWTDLQPTSLNYEEQATRTVHTLQRLVKDLPPSNRQLLLYLLDLLAVFASSSFNDMTAERLVSCLQPSILSKPPGQMSVEDYEQAAKVVEFMIDNQDHFLIGLDETSNATEEIRDAAGRSNSEKIVVVGNALTNAEGRKSQVVRSASLENLSKLRVSPPSLEDRPEVKRSNSVPNRQPKS